jgi:hypothetical protein
MYTSLGMIALAASLLSSAVPESPTWRLRYDLARQEGREQGKPLAVVIGSGQRGYEDVSEQGKLSGQARQLLAQKYIPVYVDASTAAGQQLAAEFAIEGTGIVLSDQSGAVQAFSHEGTLDNEVLAGYLQRFAEPGRVVRTTERARSQQVSLYPPQESYSAPAAPTYSFAPAYFGGSFGGGCRT